MDIFVFNMGDKENLVNIVKVGLSYVIKNVNDLVIIDIVGRFYIDEVFMDELKFIKLEVKLYEIFLVVDFMIG